VDEERVERDKENQFFQQPLQEQQLEPTSADAPPANQAPPAASPDRQVTGQPPATPDPLAAGETPGGDASNLLSIDEFGKLELRVAVVRAAERVAGTDRLLKLDVDLGTEQRTIISGIAHVYPPESLVGRRIVLVANLQPARIRGVESRGMLLAAGGRAPGEELSLVTPDKDVPPGTRVS
jgi:methionyl-tRNA synthetase